MWGVYQNILKLLRCLFPILLIRLQWCAQAFSLLSMFDCFKYHQPLLGLPSTALVQGCLECRNILNAWRLVNFSFGGGECWSVVNVTL